MRKTLDGMRVAVLAADGYEQVEVAVPVRALRRVGADVRVLSIRPGRLKGVNFLWRGGKLPVDDVVSDARPEDYGALFLPGGFVSPDLLRQSRHALEFVRGFERLGRPIATLCHGPEVLISAGLASGRRLTSWPGIAGDVTNAGGSWVDAPVVHDGRLVSSRGPQDLPRFVPAMLDLFAREGARRLPDLPRRRHWAAQASRLGTWGVPAALGLGLWAVAFQQRRAATRQIRDVALLATGAAAVSTGAWLAAQMLASRSLARRSRELGRDGAARPAFAAPAEIPLAITERPRDVPPGTSA